MIKHRAMWPDSTGPVGRFQESTRCQFARNAGAKLVSMPEPRGEIIRERACRALGIERA